MSTFRDSWQGSPPSRLCLLLPFLLSPIAALAVVPMTPVDCFKELPGALVCFRVIIEEPGFVTVIASQIQSWKSALEGKWMQ